MTSNDMNQIRELLIGEFSQEVKNQLKLLNERVDQLQEDNKQEIERVAKSLDSKINKVYKISNERFESLKDTIEKKIKEQETLTQDELSALQEVIALQQETSQKSLHILKSRFESKLKDLKDDYIRRNVSKDSLASIFLEYSLKLKESTIEDELKDKLQ
jgi:gas vesicle protein